MYFMDGNAVFFGQGEGSSVISTKSQNYIFLMN